MLVAFIVIFPIGFGEALPAFTEFKTAYGRDRRRICSSVIPYARTSWRWQGYRVQPSH